MTIANKLGTGELCYVSVTTSIPLPIEEVTSRFDIRLFQYLSPTFPKLVIRRYDGQMKGNVIHLQLGFWPVFFNWKLVIIDDWNEPNRWGFVDVGTVLPFPLTAWRHEHKLVAIDEHTTVIEDRVEYKAGPSWLTKLLFPMVKAMFEARRKPYIDYFYGAS